MIRISIPGWPPSVNNSHFSRRRVLKPHARLWIDQATAIAAALVGKQRLKPGAQVAMDIRLYGTWATKGGDMKRTDISNRIKLLEDVVAQVCNFDDKQVVDLRARKIQSGDVRTEVDIWDTRTPPF